MPYLLQYLVKFSISLALLYMFYKLVLRPLTFYQWNRFYLLCYSLVSFFIPFININPWVATQVAKDNTFINIIPAIGNYSPAGDNLVTANMVADKPSWLQQFTITDWIILLFCLGIVVMLVRLLSQYLSLRRIRKAAVLLNENAGIQLYETTVPVGPFSFGNAIYFNRQLHSDEELQRIIQHEFVHVQQKHTIDLMAGEFLCVVNWFNPFAWFIRHAIRQNLEFIADNNVIENGLDKKEYQYLLLKVVGIPQYSIASNFNFSNLKKRIAMMNKMKSARLHLTKFLFALPLLAVLLLAFRNQSKNNIEKGLLFKVAATDTIPAPPHPVLAPAMEYNEKGYRVTVVENDGERIVLVKDKANKIVKAITLEEWNNDKEKNESLYGKLLTAFVIVPDHPLYKIVPDLPPNVERIKIYSNTDKKAGKHTYRATVTLKDGTKEIYNLDDKIEKQQYIKKYGEIKNPPLPPSPVPAVTTVGPVGPVSMNTIIDEQIKPIAPVPSIPAKKPAEELIKPTAPVPPAKLKTIYNKNDVNRPAVVIDDVIQAKDFDLNNLNTTDIESVFVLKDISATIKYGVIAKNGAIEITTKRNRLKQMTLRKDTIVWKTDGDKGFTKPGYLINGKPVYKKEVNRLKSDDIERTEFSRDNVKVGNPYDGTINIITKDAKDKKEASMFKEIRDDADKVIINGRINNTVYIGMENVITVSVKAIPFEKIVARVNNGSVEKKANCFVLKPIHSGENAELKIYAQQQNGLKEIATRYFRVDRLAGPEPTVNPIDHMIANAVLQKDKVSKTLINNNGYYISYLDIYSSQQKQQVEPAKPIVILKDINHILGKAALFIVNGSVQTNDFNLNRINPNDLESIHIIQDKNATEKFGGYANYGIVEIKTTHNNKSLQRNADLIFCGLDNGSNKIDLEIWHKSTEVVDHPKSSIEGYLYYVNGIAKTNEDIIKTDLSQAITVTFLSDKDALFKYGDRAKNGVIERRIAIV